MKTILIPITTNFFSRTFLQTDALSELLKDPEIRIVCLSPKNRRYYYEKTFGHDRLLFDELPDTSAKTIESVFRFLEVWSIKSKTQKLIIDAEFHRKGSKASFFLRLITFMLKKSLWFLGAFRWWRQGIRFCYSVFSSTDYHALFGVYHPELVFAPTMLPADAHILREAKKFGIKTAGVVLSWDNLYSKTFFRVHPDRVMVASKTLEDLAVEKADYPRNKLEVIGIPQYDRYANKKPSLSRDEFIRKLGGDPSKKLILYALSGKKGISIEHGIIELLYRIVKENMLKEPVEVLIRPYPRYDFSEEKLSKWRHEYGFRAESSLAHIDGKADEWEFDDVSLDFLQNSLAHADVIITMYSTFFIEGAIHDKPLVAIGFDGLED